MKSLRTGITKLLNFLAGVSFIIMVVLTVWQVVTRYVLNNPSSWTEELVSYMFAWMALLGTALGQARVVCCRHVAACVAGRLVDFD